MPDSVQSGESQLLGAFLEASPVGVAFLDADCRFTHVNPWLAARNGAPVQAHIGRRPAEVAPALAVVESLVQRVLATGETVSGVELSGPLPGTSGPVCHYLASYYPVRAPDGRVVGAGAIVSDVTEQRRAEEALRLSERRWRTMVEQSPLSTQVLAPDGRTLVVNAAFTRLFGVTAEDLAGYNLLADQQLVEKGLMPFIEKAFAGEASAIPAAPYVTAFGSRAGETAWVEAFIYPVKDDTGRVSEVVLIHTDISERLAAERAQRELNTTLEARVQERTRELAERNAEQETFIYTVSHDLRQPLLAIEGMSDLLKEAVARGDAAEADFLLGRVQANAARMGDLLGDLLALSRVGRALEAEQAVDLARLAQEVISELGPRLQHRKVALDSDLDGSLALCAPSDAYQLLANLLSNAVKWAGAAGRAPLVRVSTRREGELVRLVVEDNGPGIPPEQRERVFELFRKLDAKSEGTGVGLAIVKRIAERHGGSVTIADSPLGGASFQVTLPAVVAARAPGGPPPD